LAYIDLKAAAIANGAALSPAVPLGEKTLVGIVMPAVWTTAAITFQVSVDDATFNELYDGAGNAISITAAAGQFIPIDPAKWRGVTSVKARSGTSASPVNQGQASVLQLVTRAVY
jgi:hypothetical protein